MGRRTADLGSAHEEEKKDETVELNKSQPSAEVHAKAPLEPSTEPGSSSSSTPNGGLKQQQKRKTSRSLCVLGTLVRTLLADIPLLILFALYVSTNVAETLHDDYLRPQLDSFVWNEERPEHEVTYYHRICSEADQTAYDTAELVIDADSTSVDDRVQHMLTHGASVYPNLLSPELASELRDYILQQNLIEEGFYVIENEHRYSFGIRVDQHPTIAAALEQILSHTELTEALEGIMGPNPAVIEFTGITSTYGATTQRYHQDVVPEGSAAKYGRSFVPSYSLFIPLQNTTAAMGATNICPGSHMCAECLEYCEESGFQVSGKADNWPTGWGALVNQQTAHRGQAHTARNGPERVLFILTFAPRPQYGPRQLETRQLSTGGSYSLNWMQWGHTLRDFAQPQTRMRQPWRLLRSLGLYKPNDVEWGWDWVASASMRMANEEAMYSIDDLDEFVAKGGIPHLPKQLQAKVPEDSLDGTAWMDYGLDTLRRCRDALQSAHRTALGVYVLGILLIQVLVRKRQGATRSMAWGARRLVLLHGVVWLAAHVFLRHVSQTPWAKQIRIGSHFPREHRGRDLPATLPLDQDILVLDDYQADSLGSFTRVLEVSHPGNRAWNAMVDRYSAGYHYLPWSLQQQLCTNMVEWSKQMQRRVLTKNLDGEWAALNDEQAVQFCHKALMKESNPFVKTALTRVDHLSTETRFGIWRDTALHRRWIPLLLENLQKKFLRVPADSGGPVTVPARTTHDFIVRTHLPSCHSTEKTRSIQKRSSVLPKPEIQEPYLGAWLQVGDVVEAKYLTFNEWYRGVIQSASADRVQWEVVYDDGEVDSDLCRNCVRPYLPYTVGEEVDWRDEEYVYYPGLVVATRFAYGAEEYDIRLEGSESLVTGASPRDMRRAVPFDEDDFQPGSRVVVTYDGIADELYSGRIVKRNDDGTFRIHYDDGEVQNEVPIAYMTLEE